jgi:DNA-binding NtrC family response regulator
MGDEQWTPDDLTAIDADQQAACEAAPPSTPDEAMSVMPLHEMEKRLILKSLEETTGNRTRAAELLGISVRTLRNKLNEYKKQGLDV